MKYSEIVEVYKKLENTNKRLEKTKTISDFLKKAKIEDINTIVPLIEGKIFPSWDERNIGVAAKLVIKAIAKSFGAKISKLEEEWRKLGDLGEVAKKLSKKSGTLASFGAGIKKELTVKKVFQNLRKLPDIEGKDSVKLKQDNIVELLSSSEGNEAKYIVRTVLEQMRFGVGEGSIRDAIIWAYFGDKLNIEYNPEKNDINLNEDDRKKYNEIVNIVQQAYDITNDFSEVAKIAKEEGIEGLKKVNISVGKPIKVMLYLKAKDIEDAFSRVGKPAALEFKYDGFRLQIHRDKDDINLFTRRLENVTSQFPDVVEVVKNNIDSDNFILDSEIIGIDVKTGRWLAFQNISQRIKRKYDIERMVKDIPVIINIFDAIQVDNKNLLKEGFSKRREILNNIVKEVKGKIQLANQLVTEDVDEAEMFYNKALDLGNEGIMAKALDKPYKPGSRVGYGVKIKPVMETLDLVIVKAEWGEGKRSKWLSSFTVACKAGENFFEIGKVGTGIKEKDEEGLSFEKLTKMLKPSIVKEKGKEVIVKPSIILEISFEEIQKSVNYSSGFALRFPRVTRLREDKSLDDVSSIDYVKELSDMQK